MAQRTTSPQPPQTGLQSELANLRNGPLEALIEARVRQETEAKVQRVKAALVGVVDILQDLIADLKVLDSTEPAAKLDEAPAKTAPAKATAKTGKTAGRKPATKATGTTASGLESTGEVDYAALNQLSASKIGNLSLKEIGIKGRSASALYAVGINNFGGTWCWALEEVDLIEGLGAIGRRNLKRAIKELTKFRHTPVMLNSRRHGIPQKAIDNLKKTKDHYGRRFLKLENDKLIAAGIPDHQIEPLRDMIRAELANLAVESTPFE